MDRYKSIVFVLLVVLLVITQKVFPNFYSIYSFLIFWASIIYLVYSMCKYIYRKKRP